MGGSLWGQGALAAKQWSGGKGVEVRDPGGPRSVSVDFLCLAWEAWQTCGLRCTLEGSLCCSVEGGPQRWVVRGGIILEGAQHDSWIERMWGKRERQKPSLVHHCFHTYKNA